MAAFLDLSSCRSSAFGVGAIPWTMVDEYCNRLDLDPDQKEDMFYHVNEMDSVYRQFHNKKD
jgi:hypothetical protein